MNIVIPPHLLNPYYCQCSGIEAMVKFVRTGTNANDSFNTYDGCAFE